MKNIKLYLNKAIGLLTLFTCFVVGRVEAQQDAQFTQYMYNTLTFNPAYAGQRTVTSALVMYRSQWVGLEGNPVSLTANIHSPLGRQLGGGLSILHDEIGDGTAQETNFDAMASYTIETSYYGKLSFGIRFGGHLLNVDFTKLPGAEIEPNLPQIDKKFSPNIGAGIYYSTDVFYAGLSIPSFLETKHFDGSGENNSSYLATERMHAYLMLGYVFPLNDNFKLKPATLVKAVRGAPLQVDLSLNTLIYERFVLGGAYRWDAAWSALLGFQISDQLMLGMAYDRDTSSLSTLTANSGSFEFFLRYEFFKRDGIMKSPRFF
ncbi:MAG: type IX secretion system membrane protein PorP/SprF [Flavobacteriaceae bacterium]|nr:type IX secretion system membrane protein PorP/SprF [Flavobacteriaceae bacterium]